MKSLLILLLVTLAANAAVYTHEESDGMRKICYYSDGSVFSIKAYKMCPLNN